ncbi:MAG: hypothetical protein ABIS01_01295 [Ferruginibacter sp.]
MPRFIDIVESVTSLSLEEMQEVENILHHSIIETKRQQILQNQIESKSLYIDGKLKFYDSSSDFLHALNEE